MFRPACLTGWRKGTGQLYRGNIMRAELHKRIAAPKARILSNVVCVSEKLLQLNAWGC
jgi:hypothetical protein